MKAGLIAARIPLQYESKICKSHHYYPFIKVNSIFRDFSSARIETGIFPFTSSQSLARSNIIDSLIKFKDRFEGDVDHVYVLMISILAQ